MIYILGHIVNLARDCLASSDSLYAMSAKLVRRLHKLRTSEQPGIGQPQELLS
jgi:nitrate reductase assembly molybdenum cofactor insertion protein NarJ